MKRSRTGTPRKVRGVIIHRKQITVFLTLGKVVVKNRAENTVSVILTTSPIKKAVIRKAESTGNIRAENAHAMRTVLTGKRIRKLKVTADLMNLPQRKIPFHRVRSLRKACLRAVKN